MKPYLKEFEKLVDIMTKLRSENGCQWDKKQTYNSLIKYLFSECQELKSAVRKKDIENMEEELGDVLLQIIFYSQIAKERKEFDIKGVIKNLNAKLIRRHPHIFGNYKVKNTKDIVKMWNEIKKKEKADKLKNK
ncbi:MAG: MazG family protein [Elusimicrobiota bacterium]|jgi:tetrapyrrole methylase family protein/MazG family protein|nr:MazG family protein [Elusimicrobiota bacterium]